jgi:hypothetical protein
MKRFLPALAAALFAAAVYGQSAAPSDVPAHKCEPKPEYPGRVAMTSDIRRKVFERDVKNYQECMTKYLEARKVLMKANEEAANAAIAEYNAIMKQLNEAQQAATQ